MASEIPEAPQGLLAAHLSRRSGPLLGLPLGTRAPLASLGPALALDKTLEQVAERGTRYKTK